MGGGPMEPAVFSASHLFGGSDDDVSADDGAGLAFVERQHTFPGMELRIREFSFHRVNANLLWPGTIVFAQWLVDHKHLLEGRRVLELGSGTGALSIFVRKSFAVELTTCDYDDEEIERNIRHNFEANREPSVPHIRHTWGETFPVAHPRWDVIIASDILLYVKQYPNLIKTLCHLLGRDVGERDTSAPDHDSFRGGSVSSDHGLAELPSPCLLMSWRRRIGKQEDSRFFSGCTKEGLQCNVNAHPVVDGIRIHIRLYTHLVMGPDREQREIILLLTQQEVGYLRTWREDLRASGNPFPQGGW